MCSMCVTVITCGVWARVCVSVWYVYNDVYECV